MPLPRHESSRYNGPPLPTASAGVAFDRQVSVTLDGLEVTQTVQDMAHSVPLIAGKATFVRVYLGTTSVTPVTVRGVLRVKSSDAGSTWIQVPSIRPVLLNPAENGNVRVKRELLDKSLNFQLPATVTGAGSKWTVALFQVQQVTPPGAVLPVPAGALRTVTYQATPPLRVRVIGIRYTDATHGPPTTHEPAAKDFALIRSWLGRAYPVAQVSWSQAVLNGPLGWPFDPVPNDAAKPINAFLRALRAQDMAHGGDRRTHYFGLVDDAAGLCFMRGLASGVPSTPDPSTVASGPTGSATGGWDMDGSYGDWYTGHELGHTFGRLHAMFCGAVDGGPYPFPAGQISPNDGSFVGFDAGDPNNGVPMRALPGVVWHDVMTYCINQWMSSFTYIGIRDRIVAEAALPAGPAQPAAGAAPGGGGNMPNAQPIHVVATINVTKDTGKILFVTPLPAAGTGATAGAATANYVLRLKKAADGAVIDEFPAPFYPDSCTDAKDDKTGLVDATISAGANAAVLELVHHGKVLDTYRPGLPPALVQRIQPAVLAQGAAPVPGGGPQFDNPVITWDHAGGAGPAAGAAIGPAGAAVETASGTTYTVQLSTDDGHTWSTIGLGLRQPQTTIDRTLLEGAQRVQIRVMATNGFQSETTTKTFSVDDL